QDAMYAYLAGQLHALGLAYVHLTDQSVLGSPPMSPELRRAIRQGFPGTIILSGGYDRDRAESDLREGLGELVAFGRPFISNPRLVSRIRSRLPLRAPDASTFYTPGERGYLDYPVE